MKNYAYFYKKLKSKLKCFQGSTLEHKTKFHSKFMKYSLRSITS